MRDAFGRFARACAAAAGSPWAFLLAAGAIAAWVIAGAILGFSDTLQLVINTGTTIVTFLMVFVIQASQNRDSAAVQLKLDELLRATAEARTELAGAEDMAEEQVERAITEIKEGGT
jgi:low affinity Fe/Cu permease